MLFCITFSKSNDENKPKHFESSLSFDARGTLKRNGHPLRLRLHSPYIVWIPQVPVLSVEHGDKRNLISRDAIFTIRQDLLPSKVVRIIVKIHLRNLYVLWVKGMRNNCHFKFFIPTIHQVVKEK